MAMTSHNWYPPGTNVMSLSPHGHYCPCAIPNTSIESIVSVPAKVCIRKIMILSPARDELAQALIQNNHMGT